ncbi:hypothetical protein [Pelagibius sp. 7325]|uniref:hypothetical protein n=1 Tax=Pelagibius sp. 7325 TaxID=3131994 RepID=UPI0030EEA98C
MSIFQSRFRPWLDHLGLDDPGAWPAWELTAAEGAGFAAALADGGRVAGERLTNLYGAHSDTFGAVALVEAMAAAALPEEELQRAALVLAACDHHHLRLTPPRAAPGGLANPANARRWKALQPYLVRRATALLRDNAAEALMWRAIFARVADNWAPVAQLTRAMQQELNASGLFDTVEVTLELNPPVAGGGRWIAMQAKGALAELRRRLDRREACPVELIRDAEDDLPAVDLAVVYRLEEELSLGRDGVERVRLWLYDPRRGEAPVSLRVTLADDGIQAVEQPADPERPSVKALRLVKLEAADPPVTGWRRWCRAVHPWGCGWWLHRVVALALTRGRERPV